MNGEERDVLIRLDTKMEYVKQGVDELKTSDKAQWRKIDQNSSSSKWLTWGFRFLLASIISLGFLAFR